MLIDTKKLNPILSGLNDAESILLRKLGVIFLIRNSVMLWRLEFGSWIHRFFNSD